MVQVVTGDSQEEVMIFRYKQTHRQTLIIIYISSSYENVSNLGVFLGIRDEGQQAVSAHSHRGVLKHEDPV